MQRRMIMLLLGILNSRWLNQTPCQFGFIGNIDAFSREHLEDELGHRPDLTIRELLDEADAFNACPIGKSGLTVIEDGIAREGTVWDVRDLENALSKKAKTVREICCPSCETVFTEHGDFYEPRCPECKSFLKVNAAIRVQDNHKTEQTSSKEPDPKSTSVKGE